MEEAGEQTAEQSGDALAMEVLANVVTAALDNIMADGKLPPDETVTASGARAVAALLDVYVSPTPLAQTLAADRFSGELDTLLGCFFNDADPVVASMTVSTRATVQSVLNMLRQRRRHVRIAVAGAGTEGQGEGQQQLPGLDSAATDAVPAIAAVD